MGINHFHSKLQIRSNAIKEVTAMFVAAQAKSLISANKAELKVSISILTTLYDEVSESEDWIEIPRLRRYPKAAEIDLEEDKDWATLDVVTFVVEWDSVENSFSKPKIISDELWEVRRAFQSWNL